MTNETPTPPADVPADVLQEMLEYLDDLRESGVTNMFGAGPYVAEEFYATRALAGKVVGYWMKTFGQRHPVA